MLFRGQQSMQRGLYLIPKIKINYMDFITVNFIFL